MNTKLLKFGKFALASLSVAVLTNSLVPVANVPPEAIALSATSIAINNQNLVGTWRANDEAVKKMYADEFLIEKATGDLLFVFSNTGQVKVIFDDFILYPLKSPPITLKGKVDYLWQVPSEGTMELSIQSNNVTAQVFGFSIPFPQDLPEGTDIYGYAVEGNTLKLNNVPKDTKIPLLWEKL